MREPKRYTGKTEGTVLGSPHWEHPEGEWVKWEDYASLKAKVSDLECDAETHYRQGMDDEYEIEWLNKITHGLMKEKEQLQAQVERLTKAGDAMAKTIGENGVHDNGSFLDVADSIDAWYKAKGVVS